MYIMIKTILYGKLDIRYIIAMVEEAKQIHIIVSFEIRHI